MSGSKWFYAQGQRYSSLGYNYTTACWIMGIKPFDSNYYAQAFRNGWVDHHRRVK